MTTHAHWDHDGHALAMRRTFGTMLRLGSAGVPRSTASTCRAGPHPEQARRLRTFCATDLAQTIDALTVSADELSTNFGAPDAWLDDGEKIEVGTRVFEVVTIPGHTRGHIVLRDDSAGLLFAGDHVLPHITPSLGLEHVPERAPLRSHLASLALVRAQPDVVLLPAGGQITHSVQTHIGELLAHHEQPALGRGRARSPQLGHRIRDRSGHPVDPPAVPYRWADGVCSYTP